VTSRTVLCPHLSDYKKHYIVNGTTIFSVQVLGTKTSVKVCLACYNKLNEGGKITITNSRGKSRVAYFPLSQALLDDRNVVVKMFEEI